MMNQRTCPKCQNVITNDSNQRLAFCTNCGASFKTLPNEKASALDSVPMLVSPVSPNNYSPPKSNTVRYLLGCFGLLLLPILGIFGYWVWSGMSNPIAKFTNQYTCTIAGEPQPVTSEDYFKRAQKHIEIDSGVGPPNIEDCAFGALNEAIRLNPNNTEALRLRGYGYRQREKYDSALADFNKAIQIDPNNSTNFYFRSLTYREKGLLDNAIEDISKAIDLTPKDDRGIESLYQTRVDFYREKGDYESLIKHYTEQIRLKPYWGGNYGLRANAYSKKGDYENAIKDYTEEIRLDSECKWDCEQVYYRRSEIYRKMGKGDLADADIAKFNQLLDAKKGSKTNTNPPSAPNSSNTISDEVLNSKAINLVQPNYPPAAKAVRASGEVKVQVTVDENGNVSAARAISGHILLKSASESAARALKFKPTVLSGQKVKVTGVIVYIFAPQ